MEFGTRGIRNAEEAIELAQRCLYGAVRLYKEPRKVELDLEGIWKVEIVLPLEGKIAFIDIDSGTGELTKLEFMDLSE